MFDTCRKYTVAHFFKCKPWYTVLLLDVGFVVVSFTLKQVYKTLLITLVKIKDN